MYYWPYETIWKHSQSCWHHMYLGISSLYCLINENIGHPKLMYLITINRYEVHPWIWFWITPDALIYPYHANRSFQCNILGFFIYFKYIPNIQGNINLEEIVTLDMQPKMILGNIGFKSSQKIAILLPLFGFLQQRVEGRSYCSFLQM